MSASRRSLLAAAGAGLASSQIAEATSASASGGSAPDAVVTELIRQSAEAHAALMRGDVDCYRALVPLADDFTLMAPFGGPASRASQITNERWDGMRRFFRNGTFEQDVVQAYACADMVVLALIERPHVEVGGLPAQDWPLRVTLVYRRQGSEWQLVHRHADPLVKGVSVERAAALALGEAADRQE